VSAIAGMVSFDAPPLPPGRIERLTGAMVPHGRGEGGLWSGARAALGQGAAHGQPEASLQSQPVMSPDGQQILVFDGRIDNRPELNRALRNQGVEPGSGSDAEVVMAAWRLWSDDCPQHLLGDFAFAVWDESAQNYSVPGT
jgi:asparagine synthase (glutamine-hydrolysing)